jgi:tyrosine-protein kinase
MDLRELLRVLWRRRLVFAATVALVVATAVGTLQLVTPQYESTSTLALTPDNLRDPNSAYVFFGTLDAIVPVYADAATSRNTRAAASALLGRPISSISVQTFKGTGIIKIKARDSNAVQARDSARAASNALIGRARKGQVGVSTLVLKELDGPAVPASAIFPRTSLTLMVAAFLGVLLAIGAALARENLGAKVETAEDLTRVAGVPSYGEVPHEPAAARISKPEDIATDARLHMFAEALRDVRTNLLFAEGGNLRSVLITSPDGSHGKTTIAFGLAVTLARAGARTLLLDADLRRGRLSELVAVPRSPGLTEVLIEDVTLEKAIRTTSNPSLDILTGGRRLADPAEMLTVSFGAILTQLEEKYETVVIDGTPLVPISDARVAARFADATLIVVSAGSVTARQVRTAVERLSVISVRPTAVILNNAAIGGSSYYYVVPEASPADRQRRRRRKVNTGARAASRQ